ncbi:hypothetical protein E8E12_006882 [Didymella heteroderae]|uniref:Lytic polysaccharide monooxygenase n=1 Tax=Didymella heteroderae TaxID=1769908 RepID=A0A9P5C286_9PLEO|nr:hypothetical protein E8E12_006882 [Didymella heteroderae]
MSLRSVLMATATLCAYVADAHIIMTKPVPFSVDKIDNSPITKSQFPCKSNLGFTVSEMNTMAVGEQQTISFKGTAVHGGGSCQLSVTTDTEPTENSKFKVIKSIEGGCPGVDGTTNEYQFEIPDSIPNGKATFAWTWFSKMSGAPELYMNCAPIEVTGGASDTSKFDALPDMLVANIGEGCTSPQNFATEFPDPGSVVEKGNTNDQKPPTGSCGATGSTPANPSSPAGSGAPASSAAAPPAGAGATSAAATSAATTGGAGGVFAPGASSAAAIASTKTTLVTVTGTPSAPAASKPAVTTPAAGTGVSGAAPTTAPAAGGSSTGTCSTNGAIVCNGTTQFGICNNGSIVWQAVAAGTTCNNGTISKRAYNGRVVRRNRRSLVGHVHKH